MFKPDASPEEIAGTIEQWFEQAASARATVERQWLLNMAFFYGKQWVTWGPATGAGLARLIEPKAPKWRVRLTVNKIEPYVRREMSRLASQKPRGYVLPQSPDEADKSAARVAEQIVEYVHEEVKLDEVMELTDWWVSICGPGFIKTRFVEEWDPKNEVMGRLRVEAIRPFDLYVPNQTETRLQEQDWVMHVTSMPRAKVKEIWGEDVEANDGISEVEQRVRNVMSVFNEKLSDKVIVKETWIKPCKNFPEGLVVTVANGRLLPFKAEVEESPSPEEFGEPKEVKVPAGTIAWPFKHGEYPFTRRGHTMSGKFYDSSFVSTLISLQREYNRTRSQLIENKNITSRPQWAIQSGSIDKNELTTEPGAVLQHAPGSPPPQPIQSPQLPAYVMEHVRTTMSEMDDIASQNEVSRGTVPPGVEAACLDSESLAVTRTGYKSWDQLVVGEEILAYNPEEEACEWQPISEVFASEFKGQLHVMENRQISAHSTLKHRWLVGNRWAWDSRREEVFTEKRSNELGSSDLVPLIRGFLNENVSKYGDDFCRLVGIVATDGSIHKAQAKGLWVHQSAVAKPWHYARIRQTIEAVTDTYTEEIQDGRNGGKEMRRFYIGGELSLRIRELLPEKVPTYEWLNLLTYSELNAFIEGMLLGDGSKSGKSVRFHTTNRDLAMRMLYAATLVGEVATLGEAPNQGYKYNSGEYFQVQFKTTERFGNWASVKHAYKGERDYEGIVWCPVVPSTYWVAYRNGKTFITGNTAIAYLQERDDAAVGYAIRSRERAYAEVSRQLLSLVQQYWDAERTIRVVGQNSSYDAFVLKGADLRSNTDYRVVVGSGQPVSRAAEKAEIMELGKGGLIPATKLLRALKMPDMASLIDEIEVNSIQADKENLRMSRGEWEAVEDFHDHIAHIDAHDDFRKREEFKGLNPQLKAMVRFHVMTHMRMLAMMFNQMPMMPGGPDGMGTPMQEQRSPIDPMTGQPVDPFFVDPLYEFELRKIFVQLKAGAGAPPQ